MSLFFFVFEFPTLIFVLFCSCVCCLLLFSIHFCGLPFHLTKPQRRARGVDEMLARLYEPILWRSLHAANPSVRFNAAAVLMDAFPLHTEKTAAAAAGAGGRTEGDGLLMKQVWVTSSYCFLHCVVFVRCLPLFSMLFLLQIIHSSSPTVCVDYCLERATR